MTSSTMKENHTMRATLGGVALLLTIAATATACGGSSDNTASKPSPQPTTSAAPQSPAEKAATDAEATMQRYWSTWNRLGQNPKAPISLLRRVDTGTILAADRSTFHQQRAEGYRQTGAVKVTKTRVDSVSLDNSNPKMGKVPTVMMTICTDVRGVDVVNRSGKSVVSRSRPNVVTTQYTLTNNKWKTNKDGGWRVAVGQDQAKGASCAL